MWCSPHEIGNNKDCGQHQNDTRTASDEAAANERCNEATVREEGENERDDENGAVILTRQRDGLEDKCDDRQQHSDPEQPTDA